jgi:hypothetical protein
MEGAAHLQKAVKGLLHAVHPVECDQFHPDHLAVELDLSLDVLGADRDVMNSVGQAHFNALLQLKRKRANSAFLLISGRGVSAKPRPFGARFISSVSEPLCPIRVAVHTIAIKSANRSAKPSRPWAQVI